MNKNPIGSPRRQLTYQVMQEFVEELKAFGDIECDIAFLKDANLADCRGCGDCFDKGEEYCPRRDDRDALIEKIENSDGVIFATPNYSLNVSGIMKTFLDRLAFVFHRPRFFGKAFMGVVVQGIYRGKDVVKYLEKVGGAWGFTVGKGLFVTAFQPLTPSEQARISQEVRKAARRFHRALTGPSLPVPSLLRLMLFRLSRSSIRAMLDETCRDFRYFKEKGWFESPYYYKAPVGPVKRLAGLLGDRLGERIARKRLAEVAAVGTPR
ncbi:MAG TPA: flavodoxin family protein [Spirochaetia bacterium]|nr:flavodoxin family protein [Spirochaetia bacterium]